MNEKTQILRRFQEDCYIVSYPVRPEESNLRLDRFLNLHPPKFSREFIKKKIIKKEITILGREVGCRPSTRIKSGDRVEMHCFRNESKMNFGEERKFNLIH